jgi:hypothetical protein
MQHFRSIVALALLGPLTGCIAPLPVESIAEPAIEGRVVDATEPVAGLRVMLADERGKSCVMPLATTVTDANGRFSFPLKNRNWTWIGWANNHYIALCFPDQQGLRQFGMAAVNDPHRIDISCDISRATAPLCEARCADTFNGKC